MTNLQLLLNSILSKKLEYELDDIKNFTKELNENPLDAETRKFYIQALNNFNKYQKIWIRLQNGCLTKEDLEEII